MDLLENYEALAAAIVESACRDYIAAKRAIRRPVQRRTKRLRDAEADLNALLRFFHSEWCGLLCDIDPERLMAMLDYEAAHHSAVPFSIYGLRH